jgi:predicted enzyme related to lactoylglutathione lyase
MTHQPIVACTEIPVTDMKKASAFYGEVFGWNMEITRMGPFEVAVFNGADEGAGGICALEHRPLTEGPSRI